MKLNPRKTHSITISRYRTPYPPLTLCGLAMEVSSSLKFLGVTLDDNLTFENHNFNLASSIAQKTSLIRKFYKTLGNNDAVLKSFYAFFMICFELSASDLHLNLIGSSML